jgi:hypothetical protein
VIELNGGGDTVFQLDRRLALTIGQSVLQTIEPTLGKKGPRSQPKFFRSGG